MSVTVINSYKIRGMTNADATINTITIQRLSTGTWRFTRSNGGDPINLELLPGWDMLLQEVLDGPSGLTTALLGTGRPLHG